MYADTFMDEKEFEEMFDLTLYRAARQRYKCDGAFPTLYEKIRPEIDVAKFGLEAAKYFDEVAARHGRSG